MRRTSGAEWTRADRLDRNHKFDVEYLTKTPGMIIPIQADIGHACCRSRTDSTKTYNLAVGDCSCDCAANRDDICKHVEATSVTLPLTIQCMRATAQYIGTFFP
jgi:hypothetical protein